MNKIIAAIDIGTNSILLLVARVSEKGEIFPLAHDQMLTRLGRKVDSTGLITPEAMRDSLHTLGKYIEISNNLNAERIIACGTSALREAKNSNEFLQRVKHELNLDVKIISGEEEAAYSYWGALSNKRHLKQNVLLIDIGGGSTELVRGNIERIDDIKSIPLGAVRLTEKFVTTDPIDEKDYRRLEEFVSKNIQTLKTEWMIENARLVGVDGTITTLAAITQKMDVYDPQRIDGYELRKSTVSAILGELRRKFLSQRRQIVGLEPKRADIILAGTLILFRIMEIWGFNHILVSDRGLRYGMILKAWEKSL